MRARFFCAYIAWLVAIVMSVVVGDGFGVLVASVATLAMCVYVASEVVCQ